MPTQATKTNKKTQLKNRKEKVFKTTKMTSKKFVNKVKMVRKSWGLIW